MKQKPQPKFVVGIMGKAGAGKDTVADIILSKLENGKKYSFADPLKKMCSEVFDIPIEWMYDQDLKKREVIINFKNSDTIQMMNGWVDDNIAQNPKWRWILAKPHLSGFGNGMRYQQASDTLLSIFQRELLSDPDSLVIDSSMNIIRVSIRKMLQVMGTEVIRNNIDEHFWAEIKEDVDKNSIYVIPDCRFESELECISSYKKHLIIVVDNDDLDYSSTDSHASEKLVDTVDQYLLDSGKQPAIHINNNLQGDYRTLTKQIIDKVNFNVKYNSEGKTNDNDNTKVHRLRT